MSEKIRDNRAGTLNHSGPQTTLEERFLQREILFAAARQISAQARARLENSGNFGRALEHWCMELGQDLKSILHGAGVRVPPDLIRAGDISSSALSFICLRAKLDAYEFISMVAQDLTVNLREKIAEHKSLLREAGIEPGTDMYRRLLESWQRSFRREYATLLRSLSRTLRNAVISHHSPAATLLGRQDIEVFSS